jgi:hypothetical protein
MLLVHFTELNRRIDCCQSEAPEPDNQMLRMSIVKWNDSPTLGKTRTFHSVHILRLPQLSALPYIRLHPLLSIFSLPRSGVPFLIHKQKRSEGDLLLSAGIWGKALVVKCFLGISVAILGSPGTSFDAYSLAGKLACFNMADKFLWLHSLTLL